MTFITSSFVHKNDVHSSDKFAIMIAYNYRILKYVNIHRIKLKDWNITKR